MRSYEELGKQFDSIEKYKDSPYLRDSWIQNQLRLDVEELMIKSQTPEEVLARDSVDGYTFKMPNLKK